MGRSSKSAPGSAAKGLGKDLGSAIIGAMKGLKGNPTKKQAFKQAKGKDAKKAVLTGATEQSQEQKLEKEEVKIEEIREQEQEQSEKNREKQKAEREAKDQSATSSRNSFFAETRSEAKTTKSWGKATSPVVAASVVATSGQPNQPTKNSAVSNFNQSQNTQTQSQFLNQEANKTQTQIEQKANKTESDSYQYQKEAVGIMAAILDTPDQPLTNTAAARGMVKP